MVVASSGPVTTIATSAFYGFTGVTFDQIEVSTIGDDPANGNIALLDDIQLGTPPAAPEPSSVATFALAGLGLGGLMLRARRRGKPA